jgi:hypothetical protein
VEQLNRYLADFDRSPTVQALLVLMLVFMRYIVGDIFSRRAEKRKRPQRPKVTDANGD